MSASQAILADNLIGDLVKDLSQIAARECTAGMHGKRLPAGDSLLCATDEAAAVLRPTEALHRLRTQNGMRSAGGLLGAV